MARKTFFTVAEAAEILGVSPRTVRNYIYDGRLENVWLTDERKSQYAIAKEDVREFKKAREKAQKAAQKARKGGK